MTRPDLNLLVTLDVLLAEGNVAKAARRLRLSPSAMSRALTRLRETTGDPLLVRAGRGLVPTPRALELREQVRRLVEESEAVLRPADRIDLATLDRTFTLRTSDGFVENFGPALINRVTSEAPGVRLSFAYKSNRDSAPLRDGVVDVETGVVGAATGPEIRAQGLFRDRFIGVVRRGHLLSRGEVSMTRYAECGHVFVSRRGALRSAVDDALEASGHSRRISAIVSGYAAAVSLARSSDLVATVPEHHTGNLQHGLFSFPLPVALPEFTVSLMWHPRVDVDPAHRWLRQCIREVCAAALAPA